MNFKHLPMIDIVKTQVADNLTQSTIIDSSHAQQALDVRDNNYVLLKALPPVCMKYTAQR